MRTQKSRTFRASTFFLQIQDLYKKKKVNKTDILLTNPSFMNLKWQKFLLGSKDTVWYFF